MDYFLLDSFENIRNLTPAGDIYSTKIIFLFLYINGDIYQQTYYIKDLINLYYFIILKSGNNNNPKYIGFLLPKQIFDNVINKEIFLLNEIKKSPLKREMELILRINLSKNNYIIKQINYNNNDIKQEYFNFSFLLK